MAGMVTQSRTISRTSLPWSNRDSSTSSTTSGTFVQPCTQTTTSFRSGSSELPIPPEPIPTNRREEYQLYRNDYRKNKRKWDTGHPFSTEKQEHHVSHPEVVIHSATGGIYRGPLLIETGFGTYGTTSQRRFLSIPSFNSGKYGATAISLTAPTSPVADLAVLLGELKKEGLPKLGGAEYLRERTSRAKALGGEYLNVEFGWKPLVSGIVQTMLAVDRAEALMQQYRRDSGRWVRRSYEFQPEVIASHTHARTTSQALRNVPNTSSWSLSAPWFTNGRTGRLTESVTITRKVWFSGAYTYYLPKESNHPLWKRVEGYRQKASHLLGLRITPEVLWNLQPWTWLVDWEGNIGRNISSFTALQTDSLVIVYAYLMCETRAEHTYTVSGVQTHKGVLPDFSETFTTIKKERVRATPYGFGLNPANFTARQWSILAALGFTRGGRNLRGL